FLGGRALSGRQSNGVMARFGYLHDITEHKLYQEATVKARAAEEASEAKSEFLSRMSHELRTPLNAILGFAQLLKLSEQDPLSDQQRGKVDVMEEAGRHLLAVINDVLDLSRIEAGRLPLSLEPVSVRSAFDHAITLVGNLPETGRVTLQRWNGEDLGVSADRVRLQQVLVNLLSNAIKYNRAGGLVELSAWADDDRVALQIADTGRGMTPEQLAHMFEPFNRLGAEGSGIEGTGIGLVIVRRLLQLMHGDVEVHSQPGQGTRLICWLPAAPLPSAKAGLHDGQDRPRRLAIQQDTALTDEQPFTVLYVEDNEVNIDLVAEVLSMCPYCALSVARSGHEALEMVRATRPDMLLLDMQLGDMTGFDVVRLLDREPETTGIPRVALSADAMPDTLRQAQAWGFRWYLTKPMDVMALVSVIDALSSELGKRPATVAPFDAEPAALR
ncbi:MAG: response regulator, partial [Rubrivivax sp.]